MKKIFLVIALAAMISPAIAQNKKFATDSLRVDRSVHVGMRTTDISLARGSIVARAFTAATDSVDASTIGFLPNVFGVNYVLSYHSGAGSDLPMALSVGLSGATYVLASGNLGINTTSIGTSGANVVSVKVGTAPSTSPADVVQIGAVDVNGSAEFYVRNEAGKVTYLSQAIGDTIEVDVFPALDTTSTNNGAGSISLSRLSIRRTIQYWSQDDANSDTLLFSIGIPQFADSLEYIVPIFRANASSGNYYFNFLWEFTDNDAAIDNSLTYTNSHTFTISAPSASGDIRSGRSTLASGAAKSTGTARWIDGAFIRVGGNGSDTASGNSDLMGLLLGWSRKKG